MANAIKLNLPPADSLFTTQEERDDAKRERVVILSLDEVSDFPNHPFKVRMDAEMQETVASVEKYGVLVPGIVRPKDGGGYEMIAGHRRKMASELAGLDTMPFLVRNLTNDEATIIMVDSNLQRERILPSEKAFAYKMKLDAMKRQAGRPSHENGSPVANHLRGLKSATLIGEQAGDSKDQVYRYIHLTDLTPELLQMVDDGVLREKGKPQIAIRPAVELSFLPKEQQQIVLEAIESECCTPNHEQALRMREKSREGELDADVVFSIMREEKPNQTEQFRLPREKISRFFAPGTSNEKMQETIIKALELWRKRELNRDAR